ncbi:MAG: class II aldolase/adducin family protein [Anaerolineae bacterium]|nr:class II aldolase/adducin family protein [Anaerolineae bacterium]MCO5204029.1 class II aldolase/adducin family protein [Anaerolineae bacterium]
MKPTERQLQEEIVRIGRIMYEKGYISSVEGNLSIRVAPDRILITPSGLHKGFLEPDHILVVDADGRRVGGYGQGRHFRPTSELPMHLEAYRQRPDISAIVHAHPKNAIVLSIAGIPIADCLIPEVIVLLGLIPTAPYSTPSSDENAFAIRTLIRDHDAVMLARHGSLTVGNDLMQAFIRLETLENSAEIGLKLAQLGVHNPLPPDEIRKLLAQRRRLGLARPGESLDFCETCGVCHVAGEHPPMLMRRGMTDTDAIRDLVSQAVRQALPASD